MTTSIGTPLLLAYNNLVDSSSVAITASSSATKFPVSNVRVSFRQVRWRTTSKSNQHIQFDFGSAKEFGCVILLDHNLTTSATVNVYGSNNGSSFDLLYPISITGNPVIFYSGNYSYRYVKITLHDPSNTNSYLSIGRVFLGTYMTCTKNYDYGFSIEPVDESQVIPSLNLVDHVNTKPIYHLIRLPFTYVSDEQKIEQKAMADTVGRSRAFFVTLDADNDMAGSTYYVRFTKLPKYINVPPVLWNYELELKELL